MKRELVAPPDGEYGADQRDAAPAAVAPHPTHRPSSTPKADVGAAGHHSSSDLAKIPAASSSVSGRGAIASSRCCFMVPSTRSPMSDSR
jgi:hypothetical protein